MEPIRRRVLFSGRVQGVGFRFTACKTAERFHVTGFVRNLADGRVELIAEGESGQVEAFAAAVEAAMVGLIGNVETHEGVGTGEFEGFRVR